MKLNALTKIVALCALVAVTATVFPAHSEETKKKGMGRELVPLTPEERKLVDEFQYLFAAKTGGVFESHWFGIRTLQHPFDLWVTQEIISEVVPDLVVEAGTYRGGSSIIWAMLLEHLNPRASVLTIDIKDMRAKKAKEMPIARRKVEFLLGGSTDPEIVAGVKQRAKGKKVLLILDSLHTMDHVLDELRAYWEIVPVGSYIIVQDSAINGHPVMPWAGPGPWEAVEAFMKENDHFVIDNSRERFLLTNNPNGFLKRVR